MIIKTRFAPSPTGSLHVGSARTALYAWLFARKLGGKFVLRIEDTDLERSTQPAIEVIIDSMHWLKLDWDEGPYFQTKRFHRYNAVIDDMLTQGTAYKCYCSQKRLQTLRERQISSGIKPRYDRRCRNRYESYNDNHNASYVVRFSNPQNGSVVFNDLIHGSIEFNNQELDDLIIRRTNGSPTYNFCVVVDDFDMAITHVIRGEDHINNTPRQINILKALGAPVPNYAHISIILGDDKKKLSKRHGAISIMQYRDDGFLPEAMLNYLVRLGWSYGNKEIFSMDDMKQLFTIDAISKSSSVFNTAKLLWLNHYYINHLPNEYVATQLFWHMEQQGIDVSTGPKLSELVKLLGERYKTLKDIATNCRYFYEDFSKCDLKIAKQYLCPMSVQALQLLRVKLASLVEWTPASVHTVIKQTVYELQQVSMSTMSMLLRIAVTGVSQSPAIDITVHAIGQSRSLARIDLMLDAIANSP